MRQLNRVYPFLFAGFLLVIMIFGAVLLAYFFVIGAILGIIIYVVNYVRDRLKPPAKPHKPHHASGRIIDSDDWRKL